MPGSCDLSDIGRWSLPLIARLRSEYQSGAWQEHPYDHSNALPSSLFRVLSGGPLARGQSRSLRWPNSATVERRRAGGLRSCAGGHLALLGLLIGFTFSIAVSRNDQRKNFEEDEANAIGTEYLRAGLLPADDAARVRDLLRNYLDRRISFYETRDQRQLERIDASTAQLQTEL